MLSFVISWMCSGMPRALKIVPLIAHMHFNRPTHSIGLYLCKRESEEAIREVPTFDFEFHDRLLRCEGCEVGQGLLCSELVAQDNDVFDFRRLVLDPTFALFISAQLVRELLGSSKNFLVVQ